MRYLEPTQRDRYTGQRDTLGTPLWRQEISYRTWREQLEERSITGRDPFAKQSSSQQSVDMEFSPAVGMHAGYLPGYPASHGCVRMPRDAAALFYERVHTGTPVTVVGSTQNLARVRKAIPILSVG